MLKKIILGIVILAAIVGAVYFNKKYAVVEQYLDEYQIYRLIVRTDTAEMDILVKCSPGLKKCTNLKRLSVAVDKETNLEYLSEMNNLEEIWLFYFGGYCEKLETLPELPNLKNMMIATNFDREYTFAISDENKYNFSNIEFLELRYFYDIDFNSLNYFENLHTLTLWCIVSDLTEEQIEKLQSKGINVEIK